MLTDVRNLTKHECENLAMSVGFPAFRGRQLFHAVQYGKIRLREINNLPKSFVSSISETCELSDLDMLRIQESDEDGTIKFLFALKDGNAVETVLMKYKYGNSLCISSQAGCAMGCSFCASGVKGLTRNLTAGEMIAQILDAKFIAFNRMKNNAGFDRKHCRIGHIVVMGTGEPFANYHELSRFIEIISDSEGRNLGMRNLTVSTCGLIPVIKRFAEEFPQVNLAISLHAATDDVRDKIMPINLKYPIEDLLNAARDYTDITHRRVTFEYAMMEGINDGDDQIEMLCLKLKGILCHVNLIPLNKVKESEIFPSSRKRLIMFKRELENQGIPVTIRRQLGSDIDGACGQLRLEKTELAGQNL